MNEVWWRMPDKLSQEIEDLYGAISIYDYTDMFDESRWRRRTNETDLIRPNLFSTVNSAIQLGFIPVRSSSGIFFLRRQDYETTIEFIKGLL